MLIKQDKNIIPLITHPMGKHWNQPALENIEVDDTHALMSQRDFDELADYSHSNPSGVYEGKMWKSKYTEGWLLRWWIISFHTPDSCSFQQRVILISDARECNHESKV